MTEQTTTDGSSIDGAASVLDDGLGGNEQAWKAMARQREAFEFFAAVIFGLDIARLGAVYLDSATLAAWEAWQEAEENETMPVLGPERETLKELARLSIENLRLKQTTPNAELRGGPAASSPERPA